jgi:hypothetical protein
MKKKGAQELRFLAKIGFLKPCAQTCPKKERCPRTPIFGKNRISQTVCSNVPQKRKVPKNSDFWEKSDFSNRVLKRAPKKKGAQELRFLGKIGFLKPCPNVPKKRKRNPCPRTPIFGKNRISQTVPKRAQKTKKKSVPKKSDFLEKSDFSNRVPKRAQKMKKKGAQELRFFGKIGFLKPCAQTCQKMKIHHKFIDLPIIKS